MSSIRAKLPRGRNRFGQCVAVYPHDAIRTNTIFEVVKSNGGHTAWADKHPAYDLVNGPSGKGVDDLYTPEITNVGGSDATTSVDCTVANDQLKSPRSSSRSMASTMTARPPGAHRRCSE